MLKKYLIGSLVQSTKSEDVSYYSWDSDFYKVLRARVVERIEQRGLTRRGSSEIWIKAAMLLSLFWGSLYIMCISESLFVACVASMSMGTWAAFIGTCIQHDGNHGAFAQSKYMNKIAGWTLDMIGASAMTWEMQHVLGHHPYTNLIESENGKCRSNGSHTMEGTDQEGDPDVFSTFPMLRLHPWHERKWYHQFQHIYAPFLFALMTLSKVFTQDFRVCTERRLFQLDANCRYADPLYTLRFWSMKVITFLYMIALPMYAQGAQRGFGLFMLAHLTCGELLATMFVVNHVIEGVSYVRKDNESVPPRTVFGDSPMDACRDQASKDKPHVPTNDWAAVQCQTSVNWAVGSWFWNHQIEHHLFPSICHTNYVYIADVVQSTCAEYGVPYQHEESLASAYFKMLAHLKTLGNTDFDSWKSKAD